MMQFAGVAYRADPGESTSMRIPLVLLGTVALGFAAACTGTSERDHDEDDGRQHHQSFLLDVTLIDRDDQPVSGAILATSVDQELVGVSLAPTDADGHAQVNARIGALVTAYGPATMMQRVRSTSLVSSIAPLTLRSVHMLKERTAVQAQVTGLSPGDPVCLIDDLGRSTGVANGSGIFEAAPSYLASSLEVDGEATVIAMTACNGGPVMRRWGASHDNSTGSLVQLTLASDLSTLVPSVRVDVQNVGEHGYFEATYVGQQVLLRNFQFAAVPSDGSIELSAPGRDIADSLRVSASNVGAEGVGNFWAWQFPLSTAPDNFAADLSDPPFRLASAAFVVTGTSGALEIQVEGSADAVAVSMAVSMLMAEQAWELLLPAGEASTWSIAVPPVPVSLAAEFPLISSQPLAAAARVIDVDFVDSPEELWRLRSRRTPMAFEARWRWKNFGTGYLVDFFP
jgi:hypothetical protein